MSSFGLIQLSKVWKMLERCAEGYRRIEQPHKWRVEYRGRTFPDLPLGKRASKTPVVQRGVVRKMVRHLELDSECVAVYLPELGKF
jgi:hypothetical protein